MNKLAAIAIAGAGIAGLVILAGGKAGASPSPSPSGGGITITGQTYFNNLTPAQQQSVLSKLYAWYSTFKSTAGDTWPAAVQDPNLSSVADLTSDPTGGNFSLTIDAYQQVAYGPGSNYQGAAGVFDSLIQSSLGA